VCLRQEWPGARPLHQEKQEKNKKDDENKVDE
jgi:hypothetical protein